MMPCCKRPTSASYSINDALNDSNKGDKSEEKSMDRRESICTGTKMSDLNTLENIPKFDKTDGDYNDVKDAIRNNNFLNTILNLHCPTVLDQIIGSMQLKELRDEENLCFEGERGDELFVSRTGIYAVFKNGKKTGSFSDRRVIGESAVFYTSARPFTVRTVGKGSVWTLDRHIFQTILIHNAIGEEKAMLNFLKKVPNFEKLSDESLRILIGLFEKETVPPDTVIVSEGKPVEKFYMLNAGWAVATKDPLGKVKDFHRGDIFGEKSLFQNEISDTTITAKDNGAEFLTLNRVVYQNFIAGNVTTNKIIQLDDLPVEKNTQRLDSLNSFEKIATINKGRFGKVDLVCDKSNKNEIFALKCVNKVHVVEYRQMENIFNEKNIQMNLKSNFIVRLYRTYKDNKYLYFLMEACMGGDLRGLFERQDNKPFSETTTKFYTACVVEGFDYLHQRGCVYRNLKPENILIDAVGYAKLTDFRFGKKVNGERTYTFVGTPEYMAPEIILNRGHSKEVDFWSLGVFIYELLIGKTPFASNDGSDLKTYESVLKGIKEIEMPKRRLSSLASNIVWKLCESNPARRLSSAEEVRKHGFFSGFQWTNLRNRNIKAPFVPRLAQPSDLRNFPNITDNYIPPDEFGNWDEHF